jgi:hypothetical protein
MIIERANAEAAVKRAKDKFAGKITEEKHHDGGDLFKFQSCLGSGLETLSETSMMKNLFPAGCAVMNID